MRSYYIIGRMLFPVLLGGSMPDPYALVPDERAVAALSAANTIVVFGSFVLFAMSMLHLWTRAASSPSGRLIWTLVAVVGVQPGLLAYWLFNVLPSLWLVGGRSSEGHGRMEKPDQPS
jgi:hypothetical protein